MNIEEAIQNILDSLKRILLYANAGKYDHVIDKSDIEHIKEVISKIVSIEDDFKSVQSYDEKLLIYKKIEKYKNFSIRDFVEYNLN